MMEVCWKTSERVPVPAVKKAPEKERVNAKTKTKRTRWMVIKQDPVIKTTIKASRIRAGISQNELSKRSGVSRSYLSELESAETEERERSYNPSLQVIIKLARGLQCPLDDLIDLQQLEGGETLVNQR